MKLFLAAVLTWTLGIGPAAADESVAGFKTYMEGIWLLDQKPDHGPCISHSYGLGTEIEFDFHKSGGRALVFERPDLFTAIGISDIEKADNTFSFYSLMPNGNSISWITVHNISPDQIEITSSNKEKSSKTEMAYRCGAPNRKPVQDVPLDRLAKLTPPVTGSASLVEVQDGIPDSDVCRGRHPPGKTGFDTKSIQFELLGPVHYWIMGWPPFEDWSFKYKLTFAFVRSVQIVDDHIMRLDLQEHLEKGDGWDVAAAQGRSFSLTVIDVGGSRVKIPELKRTFIQCEHAGMHRW